MPVRKAARLGVQMGLWQKAWGKGDAFSAQAIEVGCADVFVAQGVYGVPSLLVGTDPEDVGGR
jgi:hypothetical protein